MPRHIGKRLFGRTRRQRKRIGNERESRRAKRLNHQPTMRKG